MHLTYYMHMILTVYQLWDESGQRRSISAHQGAITTMEWQPLPPSHPVTDDERLIATGGDDCAILIWNARKPESKAKCFLTMDSPIVKLAFTPDGAFIAGATSRQVLIWKVGSAAMPRASWNRPHHPGWLSPKNASDSDEEDEHCLTWDVSGQKLAYGSNSRVSFKCPVPTVPSRTNAILDSLRSSTSPDNRLYLTMKCLINHATLVEGQTITTTR